MKRARKRRFSLRVGVLLASIAVCAGVAGTLETDRASAVGSCTEGGQTYNLFTANRAFARFSYLQAHLHDYMPGRTLTPQAYTRIGWRVDNNFGAHPGIYFFFNHDSLGRDVLDWRTTSTGGAITNGSFGVVPPEIYLRVYNYDPGWLATVTYGGTEYQVTAVTPSDAYQATLDLNGTSALVTQTGDCNILDMRFDGGAPGAGSYTYSGPGPCGTRFAFGVQNNGVPTPLFCTKGVQIRFYSG